MKSRLRGNQDLAVLQLNLGYSTIFNNLALSTSNTATRHWKRMTVSWGKRFLASVGREEDIALFERTIKTLQNVYIRQLSTPAPQVSLSFSFGKLPVFERFGFDKVREDID